MQKFDPRVSIHRGRGEVVDAVCRGVHETVVCHNICALVCRRLELCRNKWPLAKGRGKKKKTRSRILVGASATKREKRSQGRADKVDIGNLRSDVRAKRASSASDFF